MADSYRRMRNTLRFLLGNLHGFDPATPRSAGRAAAGARSLGARAHAHPAGGSSRGLSQLHLSSDLSEGAQLLQRRSGRLLSRRHQGPHVHDARGGRRAPARHRPSCFTLRSAWCAGSHRSSVSPPRRHGRHLPGERGESVVSRGPWHTLPHAPADPIDWDALLQLRTDVTRELEKLRDTGAIGGPLDARVEVCTAWRTSSRASRPLARSCASC